MHYPDEPKKLIHFSGQTSSLKEKRNKQQGN